jgi:rod shape-determining protein MreD
MKAVNSPKLLALAAVALALEVTVLADFAFRVELLLLLACFGALFARDRRQALLLCWTIGLVKDTGSAGPLGLHALLFLAVAWVIVTLKQVLFRESLVIQAAVAAAGCAACALATALFVSVTAGGIPASLWIARTLASAIVTALLAPALVALLLKARFLVR